MFYMYALHACDNKNALIFLMFMQAFEVRMGREVTLTRRACNHAESRTQCACLYFADTSAELLTPQQKRGNDLVVTTAVLKCLLKRDCCAFNSPVILFFYFFLPT